LVSNEVGKGKGGEEGGGKGRFIWLERKVKGNGTVAGLCLGRCLEEDEEEG
jgi:hypothetical protein